MPGDGISARRFSLAAAVAAVLPCGVRALSPCQAPAPWVGLRWAISPEKTWSSLAFPKTEARRRWRGVRLGIRPRTCAKSLFLHAFEGATFCASAPKKKFAASTSARQADRRFFVRFSLAMPRVSVLRFSSVKPLI